MSLTIVAALDARDDIRRPVNERSTRRSSRMAISDRSERARSQARIRALNSPYGLQVPGAIAILVANISYSDDIDKA